MKKYYKIWFSNGGERTAGLILDTEKFPPHRTTISDYSRFFPVSEEWKMKKFFRTDLHDTFESAFNDSLSNNI